MSRKCAEYQVGALSERDRLAMDAHVAGCACCQRELAALERTARLLQPMPVANAPRQVWPQVAAQLTPPHGRGHAPRRSQWIPALAAAMVLLIVAFGVVLPLMHGHFAVPSGQNSYEGLQVAATWNTPLADKAALGLALLADEDDDPLQGVQEAVD